MGHRSKPTPSQVTTRPPAPASRFTIEFRQVSGSRRGQMRGWVVLDRGERISIPFETEEEARDHAANIRKIYAKYGW